MSKTTFDHFQKYPDVFPNNLDDFNKRQDLSGKQLSFKVSRKRSSKSKTPPHGKYIRGKVLKRLQENLFMCLKCKENLECPVTLECGHTFCRKCFSDYHTNCFECCAEVDGNPNINILVKDILSKWKNVKKSSKQDTWKLNYLISEVDFECVLCSQCLLDPITTSCGHTFCRNCLARVLDHALPCPLCMTTLQSSDLNRKATQVLVNALRIFIPEEFKKRELEFNLTEENSQIPVFVCTNAFPGVACPLFVYEPRYKLLTRRCLQSNSKTFAMAASCSVGNEKFASYGTILEVRDAVYMPDGTSILSTVGQKRFKVLHRGEKDGYDVAEIEYIQDSVIQSDRLEAVMCLNEEVRKKAVSWLSSLNLTVFKEIERSIGPIPNLEKNWICLPDGPSWVWWLVPILPLSSQLQLGFLSSTSLEKRLRALEKLLDHLTERNKKVIDLNGVKCVSTSTTTTVSTSTSTGVRGAITIACNSTDIPEENNGGAIDF